MYFLTTNIAIGNVEPLKRLSLQSKKKKENSTAT